VQPPDDNGDHAIATTSDHELPTKEPRYEPSGRKLIIKPLGKG